MVKFKYSLLFAALLSSSSALAQDIGDGESLLPERKVYAEEVKGELSEKGKVIGIQELPSIKFYFVEAERGNYIVSSDGRFVFQGTLKDVWHRKTIDSLSDALKTMRTPLSNVGLNVEEQLATFQFGNPEIPRDGVAFVDPTSSYTTKLLELIENNKEKYNFTIVLAPLVGGQNAIVRARSLWCASDKEQAKKDLLNNTSESFGDLLEPCEEDPIIMTSVLKDILNIESLPHIVREDGLSISGFPTNFDEWLAQP